VLAVNPEDRLRAFKLHLLAYFGAVVVLFAINLKIAPGNLVVIWPLLAWGALLAWHAARVIGLFPRRR
jgi:2TM domain-containing protein